MHRREVDSKAPYHFIRNNAPYIIILWKDPCKFSRTKAGIMPRDPLGNYAQRYQKLRLETGISTPKRQSSNINF